MTKDLPPLQNRPMLGIGHALIGFSIFSVQDATVKWLVETVPVWEVLFIRSVIIMTIASFIVGPGQIGKMVNGPNRVPLLIRSSLILTAWITYFTAAKSLHLAELVTIYFSTPIFAIVLSIFALKERVGPARWIATILGFIGVVIAANPTGQREYLPILLTIIAAISWAWTNILIRMISRTETTLSLMVASNALFVVACGMMLPFVWVTPDLFHLGLMIMLGFVGALGQYFLFEGYRLAPASAVAPFEYITLVWAFGWGYLIWHDWPPLAVFIGAAVILTSGLGLISVEFWANRKLKRAENHVL